MQRCTATWGSPRSGTCCRVSATPRSARVTTSACASSGLRQSCRAPATATSITRLLMSQRRNEAVSKRRLVLLSAAEAKRRFAREGCYVGTVHKLRRGLAATVCVLRGTVLTSGAQSLAANRRLCSPSKLVQPNDGVVVPGILAPCDGVPDGTVQAILIASRRLIASAGAPGRRRRLPQLAGPDPAVNVVRQEPVLMVYKEKDSA